MLLAAPHTLINQPANTITCYQVVNEAFIICVLGSFPSRNLMVTRLLGINGNCAKLMAKLMVLETIHWFRYIYYNHVSGLAQIKPQELGQYIQGKSTGMTEEAEED